MFDLPIIIVKKSSTPTAFYESLLGGFTNIQYCNGGADVMQTLEQTPATLVITEAETDDMDALEIASAIREIDADEDRFTYIILFGGDAAHLVDQNFEQNIDAHVADHMQATLARVTIAGCRISHQLGFFLNLNTILTRTNQELQKSQLLDPLTGLGNRRLAEQSLGDSIRQIESRGGAACFILMSVQNYEDTKQKYDEKIADDLMVSVAEKIRNLVRPLDVVTYFEPGQFALILVQPSIEHCTAESYQRIYDGVQLKSYKTAAGYLPADLAMSICAGHAENGPPNLKNMIKMAQDNLDTAYKKRTIHVHHLTPVE